MTVHRCCLYMVVPLALGAFISAVSCGVAVALQEDAPAMVRAVVVKDFTIPDVVSGFGSLAFMKKVDVSAPQDAVIGELAYREGDVVQAGAVVARLLNPQLALAVGRAENGVLQAMAAVALARARFFEGELAAEAKLLGIEKTRLEILQSRRELAEAERKHADQEALYRAGGVTEETLRSGRFSIESAIERIAMMEKDVDIRLIGLRDQDLVARGLSVPGDEVERNRSLVQLSVAALAAEELAVEARLEAARKDLQSSRLAFAELLIVAPITGVIAARYLETGERIQREEKLLTIMSVESLYAVVSVFESEALRVSAGMDARVTVDGASADARSVEFKGVVDLVSPVADASSASFSVRVVLHDPAGRLKPGMFAQVTITAGEAHSVLVVPESAVIERSGQSGTLCVISGGAVALRRVTLGSSVESGRIILSGAVSGDVIVDMPDPTLKEGRHVSISG